MDAFKHETGCCGASFETSHVSFLGLLTFSTPLLILTALFFLLISIINRKARFNKTLKVLLQSNHELIAKQKIFSRLKCKLAGHIMRFSPHLSGYFFRYFNLAVLFFCWALFFSITTLVFKLWH